MMASLTSDDIRRRHGALHQKLRAFRLAVEEHLMNIQVRVDYNELVRPTSSVFRTPKYVQLLGKTLESEILCLRNDLSGLIERNTINTAETNRLDALVSDLEKQLRMIHRKVAAKRLSLRGGSPEESKQLRSALKSARKKQPSAKKKVVLCASPEATVANTSNNNDALETMSSQMSKVRIVEMDTPICKTDVESVTDSCSTITLPKIGPGSSAKSTDSDMTLGQLKSASPDATRRGILKRQRTLLPPKMKAPAFTHTKPPAADKPEEKRKRVTFSNSLDERCRRPPMLFRQKTNIGYPYGSCFPALPPLPSQRRYVQQGTDLASIQLSMKGSMYRREKTWMY